MAVADEKTGFDYLVQGVTRKEYDALKEKIPRPRYLNNKSGPKDPVATFRYDAQTSAVGIWLGKDDPKLILIKEDVDQNSSEGELVRIVHHMIKGALFRVRLENGRNRQE